MQKVNSRFLAVILLCPFTSVIASVENSDNTPEQVLLKMFQSYASSITEADFWQCCSAVGESNGATVLYCGFKDPDFDYRIANYAAEQLGGYLFTNDPCFIKDLHGHSTSYPLGIFVVNGQDAMPLDWAFHKGIVDIEDVAAMSFPDDNVHIKKLDSELTNAEKLILRYYDQCDLGDFSCPLFLYFENGVVNGYTVCEFS